MIQTGIFHSLFQFNSQVGRIHPLCIITAQDRGDTQGTAQLGRELSPGAAGAGAGIAVLGQRDILRVGGAGAPDLPPGGVDDVAEAAPLECHPGVLSPGPAQVDGPGRRGGGAAGLDGAVGDDVVRGVGGRGPAAGGDGSCADGDDLGLGDPRAGVLPEDEVYGALDVAVGVNLVASLGEERVLISVPDRVRTWILANHCALFLSSFTQDRPLGDA
jgi:hypothetical protein